MKIKWNALIFTVFFLFSPASHGADSPLNIHVSILPQQFFVRQITGDLARVSVLVKPGKSPATYSPTPAQVKALTSAQIYFRIGVPFENGFLHRVEDMAKGVTIVDTRRGIHLRHMAGTDHDHGHGHDHGEEGGDPHIWMDPKLVQQQASTMLTALVKLSPEHADVFTANYKKFISGLEALHVDISNRLAPLKGKRLFVFHPSFGYFTHAYGLEQVAVEHMGKAPKGKDLARIIKWVKKEKARVIFVQPQFDAHAAQNIASAIQGGVVSIDPLAYDYMENMTHMADTIFQYLTPAPKG